MATALWMWVAGWAVRQMFRLPQRQGIPPKAQSQPVAGGTTMNYIRIPAEALHIARDRRLTATQLELWLYLVELDNYGDRLRPLPTPSEIAIVLGVDARTVERAARRLEDLGLFEFSINTWRGRNPYGVKAPANGFGSKDPMIRLVDQKIRTVDQKIQFWIKRSKMQGQNPVRAMLPATLITL
jgi:DNA-binding transcriptional regulator YhcF (GntR family)